MCSTHPGGSETVGVDKGYTEAYTDSDGKRQRPGAGRPAGRGERCPQGEGPTAQPDAGPGAETPGCRQRKEGGPHPPPQPRQPKVGPPPKAAPSSGQGLPVPGRPQRRRPRRHRRLRGPDGPHAVGQGHAPRYPTPSERLGQGRDGRHPNLDISTQRHCVGVGEPRLHVANRLPHRDSCRGNGAGIGFTAWTESCWTRTPTPPATSWRACTTTRSRCKRPSGRSNDCSGIETGPRWGRLHPDSSPPERRKPPDGRERITPNP